MKKINLNILLACILLIAAGFYFGRTESLEEKIIGTWRGVNAGKCVGEVHRIEISFYPEGKFSSEFLVLGLPVGDVHTVGTWKYEPDKKEVYISEKFVYGAKFDRSDWKVYTYNYTIDASNLFIEEELLFKVKSILVYVDGKKSFDLKNFCPKRLKKAKKS